MATLLVCLVGGYTNAAGLVWLVVRRKSKAVKAGQFEFLVMYILGCLIVSLSPLAFLNEPTGAACALRIVAFNLGVAMVWTSLAVKVWRVWKIFANQPVAVPRNTT